MKVKRRSIYIAAGIALAFIVGFAAAPLLAEPQEGKDQKKEDPAKNIMTLRMAAATKEMDLSVEQSAKLFPVMNKYDKQRLESMKEMKESVKALREAVEDQKTDESKLKDLLGKAMKTEEKLHDIGKEEMKEISSLFPSKIAAQYFVFSKKFQGQVGKFMHEVKERRKGMHGPGEGERWKPPMGKGGPTEPGLDPGHEPPPPLEEEE